MDLSFLIVEHARLMSLRFMKGRKFSRLVEMLYYAYLNIGVGYAVQQRIQQLKCEKETDLIVSKMLDAAGIKHDANGSKILSVANALKTASKKGNGKQGFPEYTAKVKDFILVIEDKADTAHQAKYIKGGQKDNNVLLMDSSSIKNFAENGAVHYGYKFNASRMARQKIMLPVRRDGKPDYEFMRDYMKQCERRRLIVYRDRIEELLSA